MSNDPDYTSMSLSDLNDVAHHIDQTAHPERYAIVVAEIRRREERSEPREIRSARRVPEAGRVLEYAVRGAFLVGAIGFVGGFFGPLVFVPQSNLGPLFAIVTTPLGFILGAIGGAMYGATTQAPSNST